jgi:Spy/CpxP family protein refolding chaperone
MMKHAKNTAIVVAIIVVFGVSFLSFAAQAQDAQASDPAAFFKAKCVACHGQKAEKKFDATLTEEQQIDAIMKGKKVEKPPHMPSYGDKGVTAEQAKALVDYMKQLRATQ